jgi:selenocysteine-specific elongation factor
LTALATSDSVDADVSSPVSHYILATAGHVDHGKSALVKALTGTDPDRLPEEKARGITIDLGFAHLVLPSSGDVSTSLYVGIVDVPGHEDFVKNMVAGVGSIDAALLVVAADDGWMPQTEEHLQILEYLGVSRAVVALNKIDLITGDEAGVIQSVRARLQETAFSQAPILATSTVSGRGLDELKLALAETLTTGIPAPDLGKPRLPIDRVFTLHGIGTIVTGTLTGGALRRGQTVVIQPGGVPTRIRTLQTHGQEVETAGPATRTALNLADVTLDNKGSGRSQALERGQTVTLADLGTPARTWNVLLERSSRPMHDREATVARVLRDGTPVRVHHGSGNTSCRVLLFGAKELVPGQRAIAQLRFESPVFALAGDRFVIRDWSEQTTLAGGVVIEPAADRRLFRKQAQITFLRRRSAAPDDVLVAVESLLQRDRVSRAAVLLLQSNFTAAEVTNALSQLQGAGKITLTGEFAVDTAHWTALRTKASAAIDAHHKAHPELPGLPLNELRSALEAEPGAADVFDVLVARLVQEGFVQTGTTLKRSAHRAALPAHLQAAGAKLRTALGAKPLEPPSRKELAPDPASQQALRYLIQTGEAVEIGAEVVLLSGSFVQATNLVRKHLRERGSATVSDLRQAIGASRRIVVPLLEKLDRDGVTRRQGDLRVLR